MAMLWRKAARKLHAKGYSTTRIADMLEEEFGTGLGLGRSSLGVLVTTEKEEVPPDKLSFLEALPVLNEKKYKNYLRETADEPTDEVSAAPVTPRLDVLVSMVGAKLDALLSALSAELGTVAASLLGKLDAATMKGDARLDSALAQLAMLQATVDGTDAKLDSIGGKLVGAHRKLDQLQAVVNDTDAKLDRAEFKRDEDKRELINAVWTTGRVVAAVTLGCLVLGLSAVALLSGRSRGASVPEVPRAHELATVTPQPPPVFILTSAGQGGAPLVFDLRTLLGAVNGQLGEKVPPDQYISSVLLPGQKPPPCLAEAGEVAIGGGCWFASRDVKPPCGRFLFRNADACYRPIAADPQKPVMATPRGPG